MCHRSKCKMWNYVEINEDCPNGNNERLFIQSALWQGSQPLAMAETQRQAGDWGSFIVREEGEGTRPGKPWFEVVFLGKLDVSELTRNGTSYVTGLEACLAFFGSFWVRSGATHQGIWELLTKSWALLLHGLWFSFWRLLLQYCGSRVLCSYMVWPVSICMFSLLTSKPLEDNIGENIFTLGLADNFLEMSLNVQYIKEKMNMLDFKNTFLQDTC